MIVGAGNAYVAEAKRQLFGKVGIDLLLDGRFWRTEAYICRALRAHLENRELKQLEHDHGRVGIIQFSGSLDLASKGQRQSLALGCGRFARQGQVNSPGAVQRRVLHHMGLACILLTFATLREILLLWLGLAGADRSVIHKTPILPRIPR